MERSTNIAKAKKKKKRKERTKQNELRFNPKKPNQIQTISRAFQFLCLSLLLEKFDFQKTRRKKKKSKNEIQELN